MTVTSRSFRIAHKSVAVLIVEAIDEGVNLVVLPGQVEDAATHVSFVDHEPPHPRTPYVSLQSMMIMTTPVFVVLNGYFVRQQKKEKNEK